MLTNFLAFSSHNFKVGYMFLKVCFIIFKVYTLLIYVEYCWCPFCSFKLLRLSLVWPKDFFRVLLCWYSKVFKSNWYGVASWLRDSFYFEIGLVFENFKSVGMWCLSIFIFGFQLALLVGLIPSLFMLCCCCIKLRTLGFRSNTEGWAK